jgi:hypothetical protein
MIMNVKAIISTGGRDHKVNILDTSRMSVESARAYLDKIKSATAEAGVIYDVTLSALRCSLGQEGARRKASSASLRALKRRIHAINAE